MGIKNKPYFPSVVIKRTIEIFSIPVLKDRGSEEMNKWENGILNIKAKKVIGDVMIRDKDMGIKNIVEKYVKVS